MNDSYALLPVDVLTISRLEQASAEGTQCFAFVMNISRLLGAEQFNLAPGHVLRRATQDEIALIKASLAGNKESLFGLRFFPWEYHQDANGNLSPLSQEEWRYFVIAFEGANDTIVDLEYALCLTEAEIRLGFVAGSWPPLNGNGYPARIFHPGRLFQMLNQKFGFNTFYDVTAADVSQIRDLYDGLSSPKSPATEVRRVAAQLLELEELRSGSPSRFLSYFGILESILTHRPDPKDPYDSITRQVKKKLALLDNRWQPRIDYSPFGNARPDVIWGKMYAYRSCLAHGDAPVFKEGELSSLVAPDTAMNLLKATVRAVARLALIEPQLITDLKDC